MSAAPPFRHGAIALLVALACCNGEDPNISNQPEPVFVEISAAAGLDFSYFSGRSGHYYPCEIMGSGLAWLDYDSDGDQDLYVVQGASLDPDSTPAQAVPPWDGPEPPSDRLFRNDLAIAADGSRHVRFVDVTQGSGLSADGFGMGVAAGDYDNDGHVDLYVTQVGSNRLFRNLGDGTFSDVTASAGVAGSGWSVSATFADYDADGWLDLFVTYYLDWSPANNKTCTSFNGVRDYCAPASYRPLPDRLFHNRGDGSFEDVTSRARIAESFGAGLGVVAADFDNDGRLDFYVANDGLPNQLWINLGDGTFEDRALLAGCAINANGKAEASMGIDAADFDDDGDEDLFMTHLGTETNTLFINAAGGSFSDRSAASGVGPPSFEFTGFGGGWFDYDNDGRLDLYAVNGAVRALEHLASAGDPFPFHERNQLFHNSGDGFFEEVFPGFGNESAVSRGAALADMDNDGDFDVAVSNSDGSLRLFRNEIGQRNRWIGLRLMGPESTPRPMLGSRVVLLTESGRTIRRRVRRDGTYASSNDPRLVVGLGDEGGLREVVVHWPDGTTEGWRDLEIDAWHTLRQGSGQGRRSP